ncbi:hypothetical protein HG535_0A03330 [Zygotorulaspora mrakii]|uniref:Eukaryotic translation initiation factor 3 subunit A n=1 Tax=Zygotorulaspora mrakii TaxID=42260 RepID=A0A7H9AWC2_ZYGMR|nr:uncharacterized protein HG535_0A03330 [Zygotorulaspora mrakii]QLG70394.1 hypothetical protein HG535_0A03330 [Zygotorulaspora mrakii]
MAPPALRPENALKRADDLISVGQRSAALQSLYEYLTARRIRWAQPSAVEPIVFRFLELGVELRKGRLIKDALHQYKKLVQGTPEGLVSVGAVARKYIDCVEEKIASEQAKAEELQKQDEDDDLDGGVTPDNLLISVYEKDQSVGGFNDEAVTTWMKFTWESYRAVLDLVRNNSHLEITYSGVVSRSMQFCLKYKRKNEFKRLAEMLRQHLDAANYQQSKSGNNIVDLSDDSTLQRYLEQRFHLVNVCVKLELWHEAFKSIEDVYHLSKMSKNPPKPSTLANYYDNLAKVFFVSNNQALHTAAWEKFYRLYTTNKNATEESLQHYASLIMLSALAIQPDYLPTVGYDPHARLNRFLGYERKPTRDETIESALKEDVFPKVDKDIKKLYEILESKYNSETLKDELKILLPRLESKSYFSQYATQLRDMIVRKTFVSASQNNSVIKTDELYALASLPAPLDMSYWDMEKALLQAAVDDNVSFIIDHESNTVNFVKDPFEVFTSIEISVDGEEIENEEVDGESDQEEEIEAGSKEEETLESEEPEAEPVTTRNNYIRNKLAELSKELNENGDFQQASYLEKIKLARESLIFKTQAIIENTRRIAEERAKKSQEQRQKYMANAAANAEQDSESRQKRIMEERAAIEARMEEEAQRRLVEKKKRELNALKEAEVRKFIEEVNAKGQIYIDPTEAKTLEIKDVRKLIVGQLSKDQLELNDRMDFALKKLDHTERALRKVELPLLKKEADALKDADMKEFEKTKAKIINTAKEDHDARLADHERLSRAFNDYKKLKDQIIAKTEEEVSKLRAEKQAEFEAAKKARIERVRQERYEELVAQRKEELEAKEREEREIKQAEIQRKQDENARKQREMETAAAEKQAELNRKQDAVAMRQREIEEAAAKKQGKSSEPSRSFIKPFGNQKSRDELDAIARRQREMEEAAANKQDRSSGTSMSSGRPFGNQKSRDELDAIARRQREIEEAAEKKQAGRTATNTSSGAPKQMTYTERMRQKREGKLQ